MSIETWCLKWYCQTEFKQPEFTGMVDHGAIGVFDNFVKWEFCDSVIDSFEFWHSKKHIEDVKVTDIFQR